LRVAASNSRTAAPGDAFGAADRPHGEGVRAARIAAPRQGSAAAVADSQVWDVNFDSDTNVIDVAVRRLRAKIDDEFTVKLIRTVRGMGYVIELPEGG
jgi:hypothetical protein